MNRGVLQSSPVQQLMAAGSPNWWNINNMRPVLPPPQLSPPFLPPPSTHLPQYPPPPPSSDWHDNNQELPESWSQLLMGGLVVEEDKSGLSLIQQQAKKLENWEEQLLHHHHQQLQQTAVPICSIDSLHHDVKQDNSLNSSYHVFGSNTEFPVTAKPTWPQMMPVSSPKSCVTSLSSNTNMLDFSISKADGRHPPPDRSSECNSTATGGAAKKARVQSSSSTQPTFKTDTASVLLEAIGYIRFLQSQIEMNCMELVLIYTPSWHRSVTRRSQPRSQLQLGNSLVIHTLRPSYSEFVGKNKRRIENIHTSEDHDKILPKYPPKNEMIDDMNDIHTSKDHDKILPRYPPKNEMIDDMNDIHTSKDHDKILPRYPRKMK